MVFAQIRDGVVLNTVVLEDNKLVSLFRCDPVTQEPFDFILQVDATYPQPGIGWTFDGIMFNPPDS